MAAVGARLDGRREHEWLLYLLCLHCSLVYEPAAPRQCSSDADCQGQPQLSGLSCDTQYGLCVSRQAALADGCESTSACIERNGGRPALCRFPGSPCVQIATADCPDVAGDWQRPDVLLLGSIGPHTMLNWDGSASAVDHVRRLVDSINLGLEEWQREVPEGLFNSGRPLAMVHCNSNGEPAVAQRAMEHLVRDIQVPAVLALTDIEAAAVVDRAVQARAALVHVESHGPDPVVPLFEDGLVWRMLPPFEEQAPMVAWRIRDLEPRIRAARGLGPEVPLRVAAWADQGPAFDLFLERLRQLAGFGGGELAPGAGSYLELRNVDPRYDSQDPRDSVAQVIDFAPDILVVAMADHFTSYSLRLLEAQWPVSLPRPHYVATLLNQEPELLAPVVGGDDDLLARLSGVSPFVDSEQARTLEGFRARYRARYGAEPGRTQTGYDALYALGLATYSAEAGARLEGINIARHFERLQSGTVIPVDPSAVSVAKLFLSAQESIDLQGASSKLDWNPLSRRVEAELGLWCLNRGSLGELRIVDDAGPRWSPGSGVTGSYACPAP